MKMTAFVAALLVAVAASNVFAAEPSKNALSKMGLAGVAKISDSQGMHVRGMGSHASVGGFSFANGPFGSAGTANSYSAGASHNNGASSASGGSLSVAGGALITPFGSIAVISGAAGGAFASAK